ncbi:MAG: hypothetical protein EP343_15370 [Deltaproteobacteria bacterium]|nr:MAG: hypothetical protein EP343_15370 [Deltaproteobacteria bacterium]
MAVDDNITVEKPIPPYALEGILLQNTYQMEELIGEGGMAWVYRALHTHLHAPVAVKVLRQERTKKTQHQERFLREAQIQYSLEHPNIVRVLEFLQDRGAVGFVQEWCDGGDLHVYLQSPTRMPLLDEVQSLFLPIVNAVHYAHEQGIIHRDLKPQNILLRRQGDRLIPKVNDFGLAKHTEFDSLTHTGAVMGTFHYMPPEQFEETKRVDARADVYSLGVILYQMTTGRLPYNSPMPGLMLQVLRGSYPAPKEAPQELHGVIETCLQSNPDERYASAQAMQIAIQEALGLPSYSGSSMDGLFAPKTEDSLRKQSGEPYNHRKAWLSNTAEVADTGSTPDNVSPPSLRARNMASDPNATKVSEELAARPPDGLLKRGGPLQLEALVAEPSQEKAKVTSRRRGMFSETLPAGQPAFDSADIFSPPRPMLRWLGGGVVAVVFVLGLLSVQQGWWERPLPKPDAGPGRPASLITRTLPEKAPSALNPSTRPTTPPVRKDPMPPRAKPSARTSWLPKEDTKSVLPAPPRTGKELLVLMGSMPSPKSSKHAQVLQTAKLLLQQKKYIKAQLLLDDACGKEHPSACYLLGFFYEQGLGGFKDVDRAKRLWSQACGWGSAASCLAQARQHFADPSPRAPLVGRSYVKHACKLRDGRACTWLGVLLQKATTKQRLTSMVTIFRLFRKGCRLRDKKGCWLAGLMSVLGPSLLRSKKNAKVYWTKGCRLASSRSCNQLAVLRVREPSFQAKGCTNVNKLIQRSCKLGATSWCKVTCMSLLSKYRLDLAKNKAKGDSKAEQLFFQQIKPRK